MIDKVLKAWECCDPFNRRCFECPYEYDCFHDGFDRVAIADMVKLLKEQQVKIDRLTKTGEWKRMSDLPIEIDDRFECSNCGNVVHYKDRIYLYTFNDYCGKCGSYNGFKFKDGEQE